MNELLTDKEIRNTALCLIAADAALCDDLSPEAALEFARKLESALETEPWANGKHSGDCTKQIYTCVRCQIEEAEKEAQQRFDE